MGVREFLLLLPYLLTSFLLRLSSESGVGIYIYIFFLGVSGVFLHGECLLLSPVAYHACLRAL